MSLNNWAIKCIRKYQKNKEIIGSGRCKHYPTCSNYAIGCYQKFNFIKASFLTLFRIIRCNPFTHKCYDPVPLNRQEKKELKKRKHQIIAFIPYLKDISQKYPKMEIQDYISLIYESTFGPYYLKEKIASRIDLVSYLNFPPQEYRLEQIDYNYVRIYPENVTDEIINDYLELINQSSMSDILIRLFNDKLYLFKQLVKKQEIKLNYREVFSYINKYLENEIVFPNYSFSYLNNYNNNYIIKKIN